MQIFKTNTAKSAIIGIYTLFLISFVVISLYIGRIILMPLALAILLAFLLSPLVSKFEPVVGRILAVLLVVLLMFTAIGFTTYILSKEMVRFASNLPIYKTNIDSKIASLVTYKKFISQSFEKINNLKSNFSSKEFSSRANTTNTTNITNTTNASNTNKNTNSIANNKSELFNLNQILLKVIEESFGSFVSITSKTLLVILFICFILMDKENLNGKLIRLIGQRKIGTTAHVIEETSKKVSRYLWMLLLINVIAGIAVALGLYSLDIPNPFLWGALIAILRFVPYIGFWIAAAIPIALSLAISTGWLIPFFIICMFIFIEAFCFNVLEPLLFGNSTGMSPLALIIAALFWTLLWGPVGLILSTPLTVCLVVLGRYVPKFEFLNILISNEKPLALHEEYYHRFLVSNISELIQLTNNYLKDNSIISFYDTVLIPVIITGEIDSNKEILDDEQIYTLQQNITDMIEDLSTRPLVNPKINVAQAPLSSSNKINHELKSEPSTPLILCIPAKAKRDELVGEMLVQLLRKKRFNSFNLSSQLKIEDILEFIKNNNPEMVIISVVYPSTIIQARYLSRKIRYNFPIVKIMVGLWGYTENLTEVAEGLYASGTNVVVTTLAEALVQSNNNELPNNHSSQRNL